MRKLVSLLVLMALGCTGSASAGDPDARPPAPDAALDAETTGDAAACQDRDGDGYLSTACGGSDCNDDDPNVSPAAYEICDDGIDNDCNELVDDADPVLAPKLSSGGRADLARAG